MDTRGAGGSIEWFYDKYVSFSVYSDLLRPILLIFSFRFDHDGFSIWRVDFKYPEELTQVFMSSNQIGGFFS